MPNFWKSVKIWPSYDEKFEKFEVAVGCAVQFPGIFLEGRDPTLTPRNIDRFWKFFHFFHSLDRDKTFLFYKFCSVITQKYVNLTITRELAMIKFFSLHIFSCFTVGYFVYRGRRIVTTLVKVEKSRLGQLRFGWGGADFEILQASSQPSEAYIVSRIPYKKEKCEVKKFLSWLVLELLSN